FRIISQSFGTLGKGPLPYQDNSQVYYIRFRFEKIPSSVTGGDTLYHAAPAPILPSITAQNHFFPSTSPPPQPPRPQAHPARPATPTTTTADSTRTRHYSRPGQSQTPHNTLS